MACNRLLFSIILLTLERYGALVRLWSKRAAAPFLTFVLDQILQTKLGSGRAATTLDHSNVGI